MPVLQKVFGGGNQLQIPPRSQIFPFQGLPRRPEELVVTRLQIWMFQS